MRASNGAYQAMTLNDRPAGGRPFVELRARQPGPLGFTATVADNGYLVAIEVYRPSGPLLNVANVGDMQVTLDDDPAGPILADNVANRFKPGDEVSFSVGTDRRVVASVSGAVVRFTLALSSALAAGDTMRLANTPVGNRALRLRPPGVGPLPAGQLVPGTILTINQGGNSDTQIVESVLAEILTEGAQGGLAPVTYRVTFRNGLAIPVDLDPLGANPPTATSMEIDVTVTMGAVTMTYQTARRWIPSASALSNRHRQCRPGRSPRGHGSRSATAEHDRERNSVRGACGGDCTSAAWRAGGSVDTDRGEFHGCNRHTASVSTT